MEETIINKVAASGIITLDLENYYPEAEIAEIDLKSFLFMEQLLREKDFRKSVQEIDWAAYKDKHVAVYCSVDALIPNWAYMLLASVLEPFALSVVAGSREQLVTRLLLQNLQEKLHPETYKEARVVVKGCGKKEIPAAAYLEISLLLRPYVKSLMYGEPCSTVPIYKHKA